MRCSTTADSETTEQTRGSAWSSARAQADLALVERLDRGDLTAANDLYEAYGALAYGLALRIVGEAATAETVVERAFVHVAKRPASYDPTAGPVASWLVRVVRAAALEVRRDRGTVVPTGAARPSAIGRRSALEAVFFDGLTPREIAARRGVSTARVRAEVSGALESLRDNMPRAQRD